MPVSSQCSTSKPSENIRKPFFFAFDFFFFFFFFFFFNLPRQNAILGRLLIRKSVIKVVSYFYKPFPLVFKSFGFNLHNVAQINFMSPACCCIVTSMVSFKILKNFMLFIAKYFFYRKVSSSFVFLTSDFVIWFSTCCTRWNNQSAKMKKQILLNFRTPVWHYFIISF